jgi:uncharacterized protein (UPF0332 family)
MSFDWREYLNLARFLQGQSGSSFIQEAAFRCAISRAYYAAFCHARNYARDRHGFSPNYNSNDHRLVRRHFQNRGISEIATKLDRLRQWRNSCDYDDTVSNVSSLVSSAIVRAQDIIATRT